MYHQQDSGWHEMGIAVETLKSRAAIRRDFTKMEEWTGIKTMNLTRNKLESGAWNGITLPCGEGLPHKGLARAHPEGQVADSYTLFIICGLPSALLGSVLGCSA